MGNLQAARVLAAKWMISPMGPLCQSGCFDFFWHRAPHPLHHHCSENILYKHAIYILLFYYSSVAPIVLYHTIMVVIVLATLTSDTNLSFHQGFTRRPWTATAWCAATPCWRRPNTRRSTRTWRGWSMCLGGCDRGW